MSPVYGLARARICTSWPSQHSRLRPLWGSPPATLSSPGKTRDVRGQREAAFSQARKWALGRWVLTSGTAVAASPLVASAGTAGSQQVLPLGLDPPSTAVALERCGAGAGGGGRQADPLRQGQLPVRIRQPTADMPPSRCAPGKPRPTVRHTTGPPVQGPPGKAEVAFIPLVKHGTLINLANPPPFSPQAPPNHSSCCWRSCLPTCLRPHLLRAHTATGSPAGHSGELPRKRRQPASPPLLRR